MANTPVNRHLISSVITGGSRTSFDPKDAQNLQALMGAIVAAGKGVITFTGRADKGPEAQALSDTMINTADRIQQNKPTPVQSTTPTLK